MGVGGNLCYEGVVVVVEWLEHSMMTDEAVRQRVVVVVVGSPAEEDNGRRRWNDGDGEERRC